MSDQELEPLVGIAIELGSRWLVSKAYNDARSIPMVEKEKQEASYLQQLDLFRREVNKLVERGEKGGS